MNQNWSVKKRITKKRCGILIFTQEVFCMEEKKTTSPVTEEQKNQDSEAAAAEKHVLSETWAQDALQDLDDFIESQGIYIRQ